MALPLKKPDLKTQLIDRLHEPIPLRLALGLALLGSWYYLGYSPMNARIAATQAKLELDRKRLILGTEVEALRRKEARFVDRLPPRSDPNEFLQYVLGGVRSSTLKLVSLSPEKPRDAGPFEIALVKLELQGDFRDIQAFLRWVETDHRLLRVDGLTVGQDAKDPETLKAQLVVLGLMGVEAPTKAAPPGKPPQGDAKAGPPKKPTAKPLPPRKRASDPKPAKP